MRKRSPILLDFEVDQLTNSIINTVSGDNFATDVTFLSKNDLKQVAKKNGWAFDWKSELRHDEREVYKLTIINNPTVVQGLLSLTTKTDHVNLELLESAPFNRGRTKLYDGVPGNLVAFACKLSFQRGAGGFVSFQAKNRLIDHYIGTLGADYVGGNLMVIEAPAAQRLIETYFEE
jgi:hypothetical protein